MHLAAGSSRLLGRGDGSIIGGRIGLIIDRRFVASLGRDRPVVLVSGTNGKTTTTRLIAEALGGEGKVATSPSGSNMPAGIATALGTGSQDLPAVLEIDEGYLPQMVEELRPRVVVLLNLSRDQLDRVGEVRITADRWRQALRHTDATIVANADDPLVVYAATGATNVQFVGAGSSWHRDAYHCPNCGGRIDYDDDAWSCGCGFARPTEIVEIDGGVLVLEDGRRLPLETELPGEFNVANLAIATVAARSVGVDPVIALAAMSHVNDVAGRFARFDLGGRHVRLMLAKNPAGWTGLIDLEMAQDAQLVIAINSRVADGLDPSWLFDVPFERLQGRRVVASGDRRFDLAVRLRHAHVDHVVGDASTMRTLHELTTGDIDVIANYTAFQDLRRDLRRGRFRDAVASDQPTPPAETAVDITPRLEEPSAPRPIATSKVSNVGANKPLRIIVIYPDLLGTYGDTGNGVILANRAAWRGIDVDLVLSESNRRLPLDGDVYLIGGGEDGPQVRAARQLHEEGLIGAVDRGAVVFAVCAGYQICGSSFPAADDSTHEGLGILDVITTRPLAPRAVGELLGNAVDAAWNDRLGMITGFENHASSTAIGGTASPFMRVVVGVGNGNDGFDGAIQGRVIGTYLHGPALSRNPALADLILEMATGRTFGPLGDSEEEALRSERLGALGIRT